jgi:hypothetical protein
MKKFVLLVFLMCPVAVYSAETEPPSAQTEEPKLYEHYLSMQRMQESLAGRSLEEQARFRPQIQRAERQACQRLRHERQEGVLDEEYRRQGGYQFLAFAQQFERYCETIR